jgi:tRNA threonylcarbamoyladenosine biosynthesis protein TsaB
MTTTLAIDTAAPRLQLALLHGDRCESLVEDMATGQAERLFDAIAELLERNRIGYADLGRVVTTTGPGSFTGLRIGLSAARGIGLARTIPVIGVPSLLAISLVASGPVGVLLDARRGESYVQAFDAPGVPLWPPRLLPYAEALATLPPDLPVLTGPFAPIAALVRFGSTADPAAFPPHATYVRDADAKPQTASRIERLPS